MHPVSPSDRVYRSWQFSNQPRTLEGVNVRTSRTVAAAAILGVLAPTLALGLAEPATAATTLANPIITPSSPTDFEMGITSDVAAAAGKGGLTQGQVVLSEGQYAGLLLNRMRYSATGVKFAAVASTAGKVASTAGTVAFAVPVGVGLGATADRMFGVDVDGSLCGGAPNDAFAIANQIIAGLGAANCDQWQLSQAMKALGNSDQNPNAADLSPRVGSTSVKTNGQGGNLTATIYAIGSNGTISTYCIAYQNPGNIGISSVAPIMHVTVGDAGTGGPNAQMTPVGGYGCGTSTLPNVAWYSGSVAQAGGSKTGSYFAAWQGGSGFASTTFPAVSLTYPDVTRQWRCDVTLSDNSVISNLGASWTMGTNNGATPSPVCPAVPGGKVPTDTKIYEVTPSGATLWGDYPVTPAYQAWKTSYPECGDGSCLLDLRYQGVSCFQVPGPCTAWISDPNQATDYACYYGTHSVAISQCYAYGNTFDPQKVAQGRAYANPATGLDTGIGQPTSTNVDQNLQSAVNANPDNGYGACFPTGWGALNPLEWVFKPIQCAFQWAFVPRQSVLNTDNLNMSRAVTGSAVGGIQTALGAFPAFGITDGGCSGVNLNTSIFSVPIRANLLNSCPGQPLAGPASIVHTILFAAICIAGMLACLRYVATIFGFVTFGRGGPVGGPTFVGSDPGDTGGAGTSRDPFAYIVYEQGALGPGQQRAIGGGGRREIES